MGILAFLYIGIQFIEILLVSLKYFNFYLKYFLIRWNYILTNIFIKIYENNLIFKIKLNYQCMFQINI